MSNTNLRIATRTSALALWQANHVADLLRKLPSAPQVELIRIVTTGDTNQTDALRQFGGTGVFTREVQKAVLDGRADIAVHSLKDLPTVSTEGLILGCIPQRAPRCDALLLPVTGKSMTGLCDLPPDARIGTGSPRRQSQLLHFRPDLKLQEIRGNVDTRIRKLDEGEYDAIILAEAGLTRLGLADRISFKLTPPLFYPAVGQGALGIECRDSDDDVTSLLAEVACPKATAETRAERALLRELRAGCHAPLAAWSQIDGDRLQLTAVLLSMDGHSRISQLATGSLGNPEFVGIEAAKRLMQLGGADLLKTT